MPDKDGLRFDGRGFSKDEFDEEERAIMRERQKHYDDNFKNADEFLAKTGLAPLVSMIKGAKSFIATAGGIMAIAGFYFALKSWGVL